MGGGALRISSTADEQRQSCDRVQYIECIAALAFNLTRRTRTAFTPFQCRPTISYFQYGTINQFDYVRLLHCFPQPNREHFLVICGNNFPAAVTLSPFFPPSTHSARKGRETVSLLPRDGKKQNENVMISISAQIPANAKARYHSHFSPSLGSSRSAGAHTAALFVCDAFMELLFARI